MLLQCELSQQAAGRLEGLNCNRGRDCADRCQGERSCTDASSGSARPFPPRTGGALGVEGLLCILREYCVHYCSGSKRSEKWGGKVGGCLDNFAQEGNFPLKDIVSCWKKAHSGTFRGTGPVPQVPHHVLRIPRRGCASTLRRRQTAAIRAARAMMGPFAMSQDSPATHIRDTISDMCGRRIRD